MRMEVGTMESTTPANAARNPIRGSVFYSRERLLQLRRTSDASEVSRQAQDHEILAVVTSDQVVLFPAVQFTEAGEIKPGLSELLKVLLKHDEDGWVALYWLLKADALFGGMTALEALESGDSDIIAQVKATAEEDSTAWHTGSSK